MAIHSLVWLTAENYRRQCHEVLGVPGCSSRARVSDEECDNKGLSVLSIPTQHRHALVGTTHVSGTWMHDGNQAGDLS